MDLRVDDTTSIAKRLKPTQILLCDAMDIEQVEDPKTVLIGSLKADMDNKGKSKLCYDKKWEDHVKDASASDEGNSVSVAGSEDSNNLLKNSASGSIDSHILNSSNSDLSYHDNEGDSDDYVDDGSDYGDNDDFLYEDDDYSIMQPQFDNVDLPPGVEASIPWLKDPTSTDASTVSFLAESKLKSASSSASMVPRDSESDLKEEEKKEDGVMLNFQSFKHFDVVDDFSDHHYSNMTSSGEKQPKEWAKRIQEEWKILEKDLPDTIYVRVYEARMDLLRAVIVGPSGTPYHDGIFVFDCFFPPKYPNKPPLVYYYSGGLRLNPNLYNCGKVCLSLLGTWHGKRTEMWVPGQSTMLQVLVSIQALILNDRPFFNEPGYETSYVGPEGVRRSQQYNEEVFNLSLKTMIYTIRRPPKHFEDFVAGHFRNRAHNILLACEAYKEGAIVGSVVIKDGVPDANKIEKGGSEGFKGTMPTMINVLVKEFVKNGSTDCEQFQTSRS